MHYTAQRASHLTYAPYKPRKASQRVLHVLAIVYGSKAYEVCLVGAVTVTLGLLIGWRLFV